MKHLTIAIILAIVLVCAINALSSGYKFWFYEPDMTIEYPDIIIEYHLIPVKAEYRSVTAYNAGDPNQCDNSPCISANGENVCTAIALGYKRCAANFVPFGTILDIEGYGECLVVDRMNKRFPNRVDIAMPADWKSQALSWGEKNLLVVVK